MLAFQHILTLPADEATAHVREIPVEHVYGSLGNLLPADGKGMPFGPEQHWTCRTLSSFRTFTDGAEDGTLANVRAMISHAPLIVFLGFAFDPINIDALFGEPLGSMQRCIGTAVGLSGTEIKIARERMGTLNQSFEMLDMSCSELIKSENFRNAFYVS